jgi:hypothetical protein
MRRVLGVTLAVFCFLQAVSPAFASAAQTSQSESKETTKIREKVAKLGVGKKVKVKLRANQGEFKGLITRIGSDGFAVADKDISYTEVKSVGKVSAITRGGWIAIGVLGGFLTLGALSGGG